LPKRLVDCAELKCFGGMWFCSAVAEDMEGYSCELELFGWVRDLYMDLDLGNGMMDRVELEGF